MIVFWIIGILFLIVGLIVSVPNLIKFIKCKEQDVYKRQGYSLVKKNDQVIQSIHDLHQGEIVDIQMVDGIKKAEIK